MAFSPAAERNKAPILAVLSEHVRSAEHILEVASGTGQHIMHFARRLPQITWQPSDCTDTLFEDICQSIRATGLANLAQPVLIDVTEQNWGGKAYDAIYCANMTHIAPWRAAEGLFAGAADCLTPNGQLFVYGPFKFNDQVLAESNQQFDLSLRARNPSWGIRNICELDGLAAQNSFFREDTYALPANNHLLVFRRL